MRARVPALAVIAALVCGCASAPPTSEKCGPQPSDQQIQESVQAYIAGVNWKDPDSVQVRNIRIQPCRSIWKGLINGGGYEVGWEIDFEVNAKNSYGGYTGFELKSIIRTPDGKVHWD
jgi:hypothetical protein